MTPVSGGAEQLRRPPGPVAPGERGATRIADRVVAKIAAQAAREAVGPLPPDAAIPHATVAVRHDTAHVHVYLDLGYPCDIGRTCHEVRRQVVERVGALVGMKVPEVAVRVEGLHTAPGHGAARGRTV
ncbi:Asp23/Gls24 family envelope stress response protein [Streptomyces tropicalis]|uniref:Asp23/Gls24 family envelope stress response protein n=1 Tax=Streptomyces tropicalis TaxID=3034234 RepID=A0ABT6AC31_9ACTN|nr:Asp23/Gls24 family envelope stress response protein [Streptomyces tropicalis]MDF3302201.1 Asp23/Gls24 family envelope stress response protein [Streptomyces tropicalis]